MVLPKKLWCLFCPKLFDTIDDLMHHLELDHIGMDSNLLQKATAARETKKQLGDYVDIQKVGVGIECPECFEMFSGIDRIIEHGTNVHDKEFNPEFLEKLHELIQNTSNEPPICTKCNEKYLGLITTKINNVVQNICFNCYEEYFGTNALTRITIGTPDTLLIKMRIPLK